MPYDKQIDNLKFEDGEHFRCNLQNSHVRDTLARMKKGDRARLTGTLYIEKMRRDDIFGKILHHVVEG